jgi:hypothetical protein
MEFHWNDQILILLPMMYDTLSNPSIKVITATSFFHAPTDSGKSCDISGFTFVFSLLPPVLHRFAAVVVSPDVLMLIRSSGFFRLHDKGKGGLGTYSSQRTYNNQTYLKLELQKSCDTEM